MGLYHGSVKRIELDGKGLGYSIFNHWDVDAVLINGVEKKIYETSKGYYVLLDGKRKYLTITFKEKQPN